MKFSKHFFSSIQDRLEIILNSWIELGHVLSPAEASKIEGIDFLRSKGEFFPMLNCLCSFSSMLAAMEFVHINDAP